MKNLTLRNVFLVNSIVAFVLALGFLLGPDSLLKLFGLSTGATEKLGAQLIGASLIAIGLLTWFARDFNDPSVSKSVALALFFSALCGAVVAGLGVMSRVIRSNSWLILGLYLVFVLAYGYLQFFNSRQE